MMIKTAKNSRGNLGEYNWLTSQQTEEALKEKVEPERRGKLITFI